MPLREIDITLDLNRKEHHYFPLELVQGDNESLKLNVTITQSGKAVNLKGTAISFFTLLPDTKEFVFDDDHINLDQIEKGQFSYIFPDKATQIPGVYDTARFIIQGVNGIELTQMARFSYRVEADPLQGTVEGSTWVSDFSRLLAAIKQVKEECNEAITEIRAAIMNAQNVQRALEEEMENLREEISKSGYVSKTGDTMSSALHFDIEEGASALDLHYGYLDHYIDPHPDGTRIKVYFAKEFGDWSEENSLEITVGAGEVVSSDKRFTLYALTSTSSYCRGVTPPGFTSSKSVINGVEREGRNTIVNKNAFQLIRNGKESSIYGEKLTFDTDIDANSSIKVKGKDVETEEGAMAKANKALEDAKIYAESLHQVTRWTAPKLNTGFSVLSSSYPPLYRLKGGKTLQCKGAVDRSTAKGTIFTLPEGFRPQERRARAVGHVSGANGALATLYIHPSGEVELINTYNNTGIWVEFDLDLD